MKLLGIALVLLVSTVAFADDSLLSVSAQPNQPVIVTSGSIHAGNQQYEAPWFIISHLTLNWSGDQTIKIVGISISAQQLDYSHQCIYAGHDLEGLFATHGVPTLVSGASATINSVGCGNLSLNKNPDGTYPAVFNVEATIRVFGDVIDYQGHFVRREVASTVIHLQ